MIHCGLGITVGRNGWWDRLSAFAFAALIRLSQHETGWIESYLGHCPLIEVTDIKRFFKLNPDGWENDKIGQTRFIISRPLHLLYLGRRHPLKGVEYLEAAVRQIQDSTCSTCPTRLKIDLRIVSNAFGEEKEKIWDWCDVLILPTLSENFGLVIAEALERGKRVITTDGAPAWSPSASATEDKSDGNDYGGRLIYLRGYRDGSGETRVELLKNAISQIVFDIGTT